MTHAYRVKRLREIETVCYRICYHMLSCETLAHEAAKLALMKLYDDSAFFATEGAEQAAWLRREAVSASVTVHEEHGRGNKKAVGA
jgi:DNA-directed RNA polymerase specialized sigma24 family protein